MRSVESTCTILSNVQGPVPNRHAGEWDGTGDRDLVRTMVVEDESAALDHVWQYACTPDAEPRHIYETLKSIGYVDRLDP